jgi:hypothetical protein
MKKQITLMAMVVLLAGAIVTLASFTGNRLGGAVVIDDGVDAGIGIGDGATTGYAHVGADNAMQIGAGNNTVAGTMKYRDQYVVLSPSNLKVIAVGTCKNGDTVSLPSTLSAAPRVFLQPTVISTTNFAVTSSSTSNFVVSASNSSNLYYLVVGQP